MTLNECAERLKNGGDVTFTFVGDSLTWGENHCTAEETYVACFARRLGELFPEASVIRYDGITNGEFSPLKGYRKCIIRDGGCGTLHILRSGVGGNTVVRAENRFGDYTGVLASGTRSDFIFTLFGVNDALYSDPKKYVTPEVFARQYATFLEKIRESEPEAHLFVITASYNDQCIDAHVEASLRTAKAFDIPVIDLNSLWRIHYNPHAENFGHGDWLAGGTDATHFTPKSASLSADYIFEKFVSLMQN
jgi:lysophospholipase L1-like esterase